MKIIEGKKKASPKPGYRYTQDQLRASGRLKPPADASNEYYAAVAKLKAVAVRVMGELLADPGTPDYIVIKLRKRIAQALVRPAKNRGHRAL